MYVYNQKVKTNLYNYQHFRLDQVGNFAWLWHSGQVSANLVMLLSVYFLLLMLCLSTNYNKKAKTKGNIKCFTITGRIIFLLVFPSDTPA